MQTLIKIGITGQNGFIGRYFLNTIKLFPEKYAVIPFENNFFDNSILLDSFVAQCDVIVHLAAKNRHNDPEVIYNTNLELVTKLISSLERMRHSPHVLFSSSTQEERENVYGKSKKEGRQLLQQWAEKYNAKFSGIVIPNVFGPFGNPFYNSVIATFSYQLTHKVQPNIEIDGLVKLIYVGDLVNKIINIIENKKNCIETIFIDHSNEVKVSEIFNKLNIYKEKYFDNGIIPELKDSFELNLFNTYRSFIDYKDYFPRKYTLHADNRGVFVELIKMEIGGQASFSTTNPGITRGNHFHTRKIERFSVIKGKAAIELRKIDTSEVIKFELDGKNPAYVDMPIWYTHNITNIGSEELITVFWINELYNPSDPDTYFVEV